MILTFKPQFIEPILNGTKIHTIREDKNNRWKAGMKIQMYKGNRFKNDYEMFAEKVCTGVQEIKSTEDFIYLRREDWHYETLSVETLAKNDGFPNVWEMLNFFPNKFEARIIHWTDFKY